MLADAIPPGYLGVRGFPLRHYLVHPKARLILCAIPKCGCSTLKRWFCAAIGDTKGAAMGGAIHARCRRRYALHTRPEARRQRLLEECHVVALVRDPAHRLASAYVSKFVLRGPIEFASKPVVEHIRAAGNPRLDRVGTVRTSHATRTMPLCSNVDYERGVSFREFVHFVADTPDHLLNPHWRAQSDFLDGVRIDWLGRSEHLAWSLEQVSARLALTTPLPDEHAPRAARPAQGPCLADLDSGELRSRGVEPGAADLLDNDLRTLIAERFSRDFDLCDRAHTPGTSDGR